MSTLIQKFPWKKNEDLYNEADQLATTKRRYENYAIFCLGAFLANAEGVDIVFRSPNEYPDAILVDFETEKTLNVEFEEFSSDFKGHDPSKCDLIVCWVHDWKQKYPAEKCPVAVLEVSGEEFTGKFYPKGE
jgi:hypothetical protein